MGYLSNFKWEFVKRPVKVDLKKKEELEQFFSDCDNMHIYGFYNVKLGVNEENELNDIELEEYYSKFYDSQLFADKIKDVVKTGKIRLIFTGEDGDTWGYDVSPGKAETLRNVFLTEDQYAKAVECGILKKKKKKKRWNMKTNKIKITKDGIILLVLDAIAIIIGWIIGVYATSVVVYVMTH